MESLQQGLKDRGFLDPSVIDGNFDPGTDAAAIGLQKSEGLIADGIAGPQTLIALALAAAPADAALEDVTEKATVNQFSEMCPEAPLGNIKPHLPRTLQALLMRMNGSSGKGNAPVLHRFAKSSLSVCDTQSRVGYQCTVLLHRRAVQASFT